MASSTTKHFDYLTQYGTALEQALGLSGLAKSIDRIRCSAMEYPDDALVRCRKITEAALRTLASPLPTRIDIAGLINYAEDEGIIDHSMALKCHEIRRKGNIGAHGCEPAKAIDAKMSLELLDDFLRWNAENLGLITAESDAGIKPDGPVFLVQPEAETETMAKQARLATALSDNKEVEKKARQIKEQVSKYQTSSEARLEAMASLLKQAEDLGAAATTPQEKTAHNVQQQLLFEQCDKNFEQIKSERKPLVETIAEVKSETRAILNEHDFVNKLLHGDNRATDKQMEVMAFPRGSNSRTNILQITGGAGTGKTLCLLAKLIEEVGDHGQDSLFDTQHKKAIFICFNKGLANYVRSILADYPEAVPNIQVVNYDLFVNQLVRQKPRAGFEHLAQYANDAKYSGSSIIYGIDKRYVALLKSAQATVAKQHPDRASEYYLNADNEDELNWLKDELIWIEARFLSEEEADAEYPRVSRIGRGSKHLPNEEIRRIILEIWRELNRLLAANRLYTVEQATKRLLKSGSLPSYDAIAIDEIQDFSLLWIRLLLRFRRNERSMVFISGDENQKIYQRDFSWKSLDEGLRSHTIFLSENMRNSESIQHFSERLLGVEIPYASAHEMIHIENASDERIIQLIQRLSSSTIKQTIALISRKKRLWMRLLSAAGIHAIDNAEGNVRPSGLYLIGDLMGKGLEFDNVIVDYSYEVSEDEEEEKRLRYVHFTRARKRLYIRYKGTPPKLLSRYYSDFLEGES